MKQLGYLLVKLWVKAGLYWYYKSIRVEGQQHIPAKGPLLVLSNHQNALLDILLIATHTKRKFWYLTRADIFKSTILKRLFAFFQMLPIYRIRDGRNSLAKNEAIFNRCGTLLNEQEAILLFPEGNHSLERRVRPLSKGFTRLLDDALNQNPGLALEVVPVGQNYQQARMVGDRAALYIGAPIRLHPYLKEERYQERIKATVFERLTALTTHIDEANYSEVITKIQRAQVDFTNPKATNAQLKNLEKLRPLVVKHNPLKAVFYWVFRILNVPFILLWRYWLLPKVPEPEFEATFRFAFALISYTLVYGILFFGIALFLSIKTALLFVVGHAVLNLLFTKMGATSMGQRI